MKKMIRFSLLLALAVTAFINPLKAQDASKELNAFVVKFQDTYNKKDAKALKEMYTAEATRTTPDGKIQKGNTEIAAWFADFFKNNNVTIVVKLEKVVTEKDGSTTTTGTFHITGTTVKGEKVDRAGTYQNTVVKEKESWKISKSVIAAG